MIVRVVTARVSERNAGRMQVALRRQLDEIRAQDGLVYVKLARKVSPGFEEILLFQEWRDPASLYRWTGRSIETARIFRGVEDLVESVEVTHFEALDVDPDVVTATTPTNGDLAATPRPPVADSP